MYVFAHDCVQWNTNMTIIQVKTHN